MCTLHPSKSGYCLDEPVQVGVFSGGPEENGRQNSDPNDRYVTSASVYNNLDWIRQIIDEG